MEILTSIPCSVALAILTNLAKRLPNLNAEAKAGASTKVDSEELTKHFVENQVSSIETGVFRHFPGLGRT